MKNTVIPSGKTVFLSPNIILFLNFSRAGRQASQFQNVLAIFGWDFFVAIIFIEKNSWVYAEKNKLKFGEMGFQTAF